MTNGETHLGRLLSWYKEAVTEDGVCYLTSDDKNTLAYAIKCCKHFEDIKKDIDTWMLRNEPTTQECQAESDKFDAAFQDGYNNGYAQAKFDYEQEPTTKNDLGVDKLLSDCEKMSFDIEIFNKPLKVVALDAVKNIVKDLSSVTPQEPRWIPVSERLPDIHNYSEHYLVTLKNGEVHRAMCTEMNGEHWWNYNLDDVIAWMPLPQPYREVKK